MSVVGHYAPSEQLRMSILGKPPDYFIACLRQGRQLAEPRAAALGADSQIKGMFPVVCVFY